MSDPFPAPTWPPRGVPVLASLRDGNTLSFTVGLGGRLLSLTCSCSEDGTVSREEFLTALQLLMDQVELHVEGKTTTRQLLDAILPDRRGSR